ncbi:MAG: hypothetical protein U9R68_10015 [Planctomycetota bacterium]|nr:hypothetical protein [Planctomycetota bacterium]
MTVIKPKGPRDPTEGAFELHLAASKIREVVDSVEGIAEVLPFVWRLNALAGEMDCEAERRMSGEPPQAGFEPEPPFPPFYLPEIKGFGELRGRRPTLLP